MAAEYSRLLAQRTGMFVQSVPVSHDAHKRAVYRLVFATRSQYGLWVFGDSVARARDEWWKTLDAREESEGKLALWPMRPDPKEVALGAIPKIADNLENLLLRSRRPVKLVDHTLEIFGDFYGQVTEPAVRKAVQRLHEQGKTPSDGAGVKRTREITVHPRSAAA